MDMVTKLGADSAALVQSILDAQGRQRFLKDWDAEVADAIKASTVKEFPLVRKRGNGDDWQVAVLRVAATTARRMDYTGLKTKRPALYHRYVTVAEPGNPLTLTFPNHTSWNALRSIGWSHADTLWGRQRRAYMTSPAIMAQRITYIREEKALAREREATARKELAELILASDNMIRSYTHAQALMRVSQSRLRQSVDWNQVAAVPDLAEFITTSPRAEYTKVAIFRAGHDPESDQDAE